uniref:Uncharacterized protein n=1 Tax=Anguilla anguilla TaxID=7936 RepID=A0A0E9WA27_ANGAN
MRKGRGCVPCVFIFVPTGTTLWWKRVKEGNV